MWRHEEKLISGSWAISLLGIGSSLVETSLITDKISTSESLRLLLLVLLIKALARNSRIALTQIALVLVRNIACVTRDSILLFGHLLLLFAHIMIRCRIHAVLTP